MGVGGIQRVQLPQNNHTIKLCICDHSGEYISSLLQKADHGLSVLLACLPLSLAPGVSLSRSPLPALLRMFFNLSTYSISILS